MAGVGTKKTFEDDRVVVWNLDLEPGQETGRHTHTRDYFLRVLTGSKLAVFDGDGGSLGEVELETGAAMHLRVEGDKIVSDRPGYPEVPVTHSARNIGTGTYREVLIEFKT